MKSVDTLEKFCLLASYGSGFAGYALGRNGSGVVGVSRNGNGARALGPRTDEQLSEPVSVVSETEDPDAWWVARRALAALGIGHVPTFVARSERAVYVA